MALTTQTMTDEQRKSVAIEYLKAFDNGGVTSTGGSILDLFADDAQVYFPKWGLANGKAEIGKMFGDVGAHAEVDRPPLLALQLDLLRQRHRRLRRHQPRRAPGRPVARRRARMGGRPLVRRLRNPRLEDPALLHLPRPGLRREGHGALSVAEGQVVRSNHPCSDCRDNNDNRREECMNSDMEMGARPASPPRSWRLAAGVGAGRRRRRAR